MSFFQLTACTCQPMAMRQATKPKIKVKETKKLKLKKTSNEGDEVKYILATRGFEITQQK